MQDGQPHAARVSMLIRSTPSKIFSALVEPEHLTRFWLRSASGPLTIGQAVIWEFMVPGAATETTATKLEDDRTIAWTWFDGTSVSIELETIEDATSVTIDARNFAGSDYEKVEAALNACEGFAIVLCDLKILLETGKSAGLVAAKALLIQSSAV